MYAYRIGFRLGQIVHCGLCVLGLLTGGGDPCGGCQILEIYQIIPGAVGLLIKGVYMYNLRIWHVALSILSLI